MISGIILAVLLLVSTVDLQAQNEVFLRKIDFDLPKVSPNPLENEFSLTLQLNKGTKYKFVVTNHVNGTIGDAIVEINDSETSKMQVTNVFQDKYFEQFMFICNKTTFYDILMKFKDNKAGTSEVNVFMIQ